jgi:lipoprotein-releasing system permease protein
MYKLYLCLQYLLKRPLAYFAMAGVALCVFVMTVCISILTGFVDKVELAAKGLFGDIVVSTPGYTGFGNYDEFIEQIQREVPGVEAGSPFILSYGILRIPGPPNRWLVQIAGIRLPERAAVSDFENGLFVQKGFQQPTFDPPTDRVLDRLEQELAKTERVEERENGAAGTKRVDESLVERIQGALVYQRRALKRFGNADATRRELEDLLRQRQAAEKRGDYDAVDRLDQSIAAKEEEAILEPARRAILGLGIPGLTFRTDRGEVIRAVGPGQPIALTLIPLGRGFSPTEITPTTARFTVIDDCDTDVSSVDTRTVYVPFETLQRLNNMGAEPPGDANGPKLLGEPARCSQVHVKVRPGYGSDEKLLEVARQINDSWRRFRLGHPLAAATEVRAQTWRQMQSQLVSQIENQRTLMWIILSVISVVALVLIFVIMYVIVVQKTRDIGVLKAVGASSGGVAAIFLAYGAGVGLIGSIIGIIGGYFFVRSINPIHDWVGRTFGFVVWSRETFMFAQIPNDVTFRTVATIALGALLSGIVGSLLPAALAARRQPVEALRYE